eukprot:CAMPEP_0181340644 /NCGR_PEP_ID=MMETSP1101-20121128/29961_1 /TAXON_ID=46948 /ORGANISM="Rhodomonas abbreviata, Strain Caron Lab Isolate" /LENGTH=168 /DNA_ID=CAMNT_0023451817 /DNA_START=97 /DNA_END=599 /DNA_ORIENTATION=+
MVSVVQEIPPHLGLTCARSELDCRFEKEVQADHEASNRPSNAFLDLLCIVQVQFDLLPLSLEECRKITVTCKRAHVEFLDAHFWLARIGYKLRSPAVSICFFRTYLCLQKESLNGTWRSDQLVKAGALCSGGGFAQRVDEAVSCKTLTPLVVHLNKEDCVKFWSTRLT